MAERPSLPIYALALSILVGSALMAGSVWKLADTHRWEPAGQQFLLDRWTGESWRVDYARGVRVIIDSTGESGPQLEPLTDAFD